MKKTLILILAVLPIVLLALISAAGKVLSIISYISVEEVSFVDRIGNAYTDEMDFKVAQGETKATQIYIYPELATNQTVTYSTSDPNICTIDQNGVITGVHWGSATVSVKTQDGSKLAMLNVTVVADIPYAVYLSHDDITMYKGGSFNDLKEIVDAPVAIDKSVKWSSSNSEIIEVDELLGTITAKKAGEALVTATTVSGGKTATCKVTVLDEKPFEIDFSDISGVEDTSDNTEKKYILKNNNLNLTQAIKLNEGVSIDDIKFIIDREDIVTIEEGTLIFKTNSIEIVVLTIECDMNGIKHKVVLKFMYYPL